jgi:hypothetical protein
MCKFFTGTAWRRWWWAAVAVAAVIGCGSAGPERDKDHLVRVGDRKFTAREFSEAFELVKTAYPGSVEGEGEGLRQARLKLLEEMTVELVLHKRADELGLAVTEEEIDAAVAAVKQDYPPGLFERTLVEAAVPFDAWRRRIGSRLLVEKVIEVDLRERIAITAEDVTAYYARHYRGRAAEADSEEKFRSLKEAVVAELKRQKEEDAYGEWVGRLKARFTIEINTQLWEQMTPRKDAALTQAPARSGTAN